MITCPGRPFKKKCPPRNSPVPAFAYPRGKPATGPRSPPEWGAACGEHPPGSLFLGFAIGPVIARGRMPGGQGQKNRIYRSPPGNIFCQDSSQAMRGNSCRNFPAFQEPVVFTRRICPVPDFSSRTAVPGHNLISGPANIPGKGCHGQRPGMPAVRHMLREVGMGPERDRRGPRPLDQCPALRYSPARGNQVPRWQDLQREAGPGDIPWRSPGNSAHFVLGGSGRSCIVPLSFLFQERRREGVLPDS